MRKIVFTALFGVTVINCTYAVDETGQDNAVRNAVAKLNEISSPQSYEHKVTESNGDGQHLNSDLIKERDALSEILENSQQPVVIEPHGNGESDNEN